MLPKIIKIVEIISIFGFLKNPIDSLWVENPPVAIVVMECAILGGGIADNIIGLVQALGDAGIVGLVAAIVILGFYK